MTSIKAVVRNGRIEIDKPINLPDGTQLTIPIPDPSEIPETTDDDGFDTPEAVENWLRWYDALEPVEFTEKERAAWETARQEQKAFEIGQWEERSKRIEGRFT
jgi:hypothetical protein